MVFEPIGLILEDEPARMDYFCTPVNSVTFGSTGGDGVHFGFLRSRSNTREPIVMTVPMSDVQNIVLAENFHEFLQLGYHTGFFSLEQLAYNWDEPFAFMSMKTKRWRTTSASSWTRCDKSLSLSLCRICRHGSAR